MTDPYKVLGVSRDATDEDIKKVYRDLAKKNHPDNFQTEQLKEIATNKMAEINAAYDEIQKQRSERAKNTGYGDGFGYYENDDGGYSTYEGENGETFKKVRIYINNGRLDEADMVLNSLPLSARNAEWNFLKGVVLRKKFFTYEAQQYFQKAMYMDPSNREYADAFNSMNARANGYSQRQRTASSCDFCDFCEAMMCADCCCECLGGDLIRCC